MNHNSTTMSMTGGRLGDFIWEMDTFYVCVFAVGSSKLRNRRTSLPAATMTAAVGFGFAKADLEQVCRMECAQKHVLDTGVIIV